MDVLKWELVRILTMFMSKGRVSRDDPFVARLSVSRENVI